MRSWELISRRTGFRYLPVDDKTCKPLATFADGSSVSVAVRDFENYRIVYSAVPVLSDAFLNRIASAGGAWTAAQPVMPCMPMMIL